MTPLYLLVQCTWGLLQTAAGAAVYLRYRRRPHFRFHGAVVTQYPLYSSLSLGPFIFLTDKPPQDRSGKIPYPDIPRRMLVHEYGHTIQSLWLGPLYLPAAGLPSALWNHLPCFQKKWRLTLYQPPLSQPPRNYKMMQISPPDPSLIMRWSVSRSLVRASSGIRLILEFRSSFTSSWRDFPKILASQMRLESPSYS